MKEEIKQDLRDITKIGTVDEWRAKCRYLIGEVERLEKALGEIRNFPFLSPNDDTRVIQRIANQELEGKA